MDYFRAMCRAQEKSERALDLTKIVIELSPSHYTVWYGTAATRHNITYAVVRAYQRQIENNLG